MFHHYDREIIIHHCNGRIANEYWEQVAGHWVQRGTETGETWLVGTYLVKELHHSDKALGFRVIP